MLQDNVAPKCSLHLDWLSRRYKCWTFIIIIIIIIIIILLGETLKLRCILRGR